MNSHSGGLDTPGEHSGRGDDGECPLPVPGRLVQRTLSPPGISGTLGLGHTHARVSPGRLVRRRIHARRPPRGFARGHPHGRAGTCVISPGAMYCIVEKRWGRRVGRGEGIGPLLARMVSVGGCANPTRVTPGEDGGVVCYVLGKNGVMLWRRGRGKNRERGRGIVPRPSVVSVELLVIKCVYVRGVHNRGFGRAVFCR